MIEELHAQRIRIGQRMAFEKWRDRRLDGSVGDLAARARRVTHQPLVGSHADEHGVALDDGPLASVEIQFQRLGERAGQQKRSYTGDLHYS